MILKECIAFYKSILLQLLILLLFLHLLLLMLLLLILILFLLLLLLLHLFLLLLLLLLLYLVLILLIPYLFTQDLVQIVYLEGVHRVQMLETEARCPQSPQGGPW